MQNSFLMGCLHQFLKCKFKRIHPSEEKSVMSKGFMSFIVFQSIIVIILCFISISYISTTNISSIVPVDIVTLLIALIILSLILVIVGISSAISNVFLSWIIFHIFMFILLVAEIIISLFTSNLTKASLYWDKLEESEKKEIGSDLGCVYNSTDSNNCINKLSGILTTLRNTSSIAMFICFVLGLFIDFAGCAICYHPDVITLEEHEREMMEININTSNEIGSFSNPFAN